MKKTMLSASAALLFTILSISSARAECEHYEFAELKAMKTGMLELKYCLMQIEMDWQNKKIESSRKIGAIELQMPGGYKRRGYEESERDKEKSYEKSSQCAHESSRILSVLQQKKVNVSALMKECPSS